MTNEGERDHSKTQAEDDLEEIRRDRPGEEGPDNGCGDRDSGQHSGHLPVDRSCSGVSGDTGSKSEDLGDQGNPDGHLGLEAKSQDEEWGKECGAADAGSVGDCCDDDGDRQQELISEFHPPSSLSTESDRTACNGCPHHGWEETRVRTAARLRRAGRPPERRVVCEECEGAKNHRDSDHGSDSGHR